MPSDVPDVRTLLNEAADRIRDAMLSDDYEQALLLGYEDDEREWSEILQAIETTDEKFYMDGTWAENLDVDLYRRLRKAAKEAGP